MQSKMVVMTGSRALAEPGVIPFDSKGLWPARWPRRKLELSLSRKDSVWVHKSYSAWTSLAIFSGRAEWPFLRLATLGLESKLDGFTKVKADL